MIEIIIIIIISSSPYHYLSETSVTILFIANIIYMNIENILTQAFNDDLYGVFMMTMMKMMRICLPEWGIWTLGWRNDPCMEMTHKSRLETDRDDHDLSVLTFLCSRFTICKDSTLSTLSINNTTLHPIRV